MGNRMKKLKQQKRASKSATHVERRSVQKNVQKKFATEKTKKEKKVEKKVGVANTNNKSRDDAEIEQLNKKLALKPNKPLPKIFYNEGLADIIHLCDKIMGEKPVILKNHHADIEENSEQEDSFDETEEDIEESFVEEPEDENNEDDEENNEDENEIEQKKEIDGIVNKELSRKFVAVFNRMSERNMAECVDTLQEIFKANSLNECCNICSEQITRYVNQAKILSEPILFSLTFLVCALKNSKGDHFLCALLQNLVKKFDEHFLNESGFDDKYPQNFVIFLALIYQFKQISHLLIVDICDKLLKRFTGADLEMFHLILYFCGQTLNDDSKRANHINFNKWKALLNSDEYHQKMELFNSRDRFILEKVETFFKSSISKFELACNASNTTYAKYKQMAGNLVKNSENNTGKLNLSYEQLLGADIISGKYKLLSHNKEVSKYEEVGKQNQQQEHDESAVKTAKSMGIHNKEQIDFFCMLMKLTEKRQKNFVDFCSEKIVKFVEASGKKKKSRVSDAISVLLQCGIYENPFNEFYPRILSKLSKLSKEFEKNIIFIVWDKIRAEKSEMCLSNLAQLVYLLLAKYNSVNSKVFKLLQNENDDMEVSAVQFYRLLFLKICGLPEGQIRSIFSAKKYANDINLFVVKNCIMGDDPLMLKYKEKLKFIIAL